MTVCLYGFYRILLSSGGVLTDGMAESYVHTRRDYLRATGVAGGVGLAGYLGVERGALQGQIPMGSILPLTGELEPYGPGMEATVNLAVEHVNDAGGPLGSEIQMTNRDSETRPEAGLDRYNGLVEFVDAASSGVSAPFAELVADDRLTPSNAIAR